MKILQIMILTLFMSGCANAKTPTIFARLDVAGDSLPVISHMIDMKMSGDTLLFVYEGKKGYGQRNFRRAIVDSNNNTLTVSSDIGKREDGYYVSYMPYPFIAENGTIMAVGQDDCEVYTVESDTMLVRTKQYLMDANSIVPFPLSQYVQDIFQMEPDRYVFIGREPKGGAQFAMISDIMSSKVDTIKQIKISPGLQTWMPNMGELVYSHKYKRLAFAYKLHPIIDVFDIAGNMISSVRIGEDTFDPKTLDEADFDDLNILHTVDVTYTPDYIYVLYWGCKYVDSANDKSSIIKLDWNGNIVASYNNLNGPLYRISAVNDSTVIGWTGKDFVLFQL